MHDRIVLCVPRVALRDALGENVIQLRFERVDVADARRARRHVLRLVLRELHEIKIVSASLHRRRAIHRLLARGEKREPRRHRERLLRSREQHINAQRIHRDRHHAERRHAVHDQAHIREILHHRADLLDVRHHARRGLVVNQRHRIESARTQCRADLLAAHRLTPFHLQCHRLLAALFRHVEPLVRKRAAHAVQHLARAHEIAHRALHHAPRAARGKHHRLRRAEEFLQPRLDSAVELFEIPAAVSDHRPAHGAESFFGDFDGTWDEKFRHGVDECWCRCLAPGERRRYVENAARETENSARHASLTSHSG